MAKELIRTEQLGWVHLDGTNPSAPAILETHSATLDGLTIDALFSEETRLRASQFDKGLLIVLCGVNLNDSAQPEDMISLRLWLDKYSKRQLRESLETVTRHMENLDSFRERAQILSDELAHFHAGKMNQNMYILSLIAAIFLPLTFLPSLLGVNIGGIPGADYGSAFALFCGLLFAIMLIQIWIFRRLKWLWGKGRPTDRPRARLMA